MNKIEYNIAIESDAGSTIIDWGNRLGWCDAYREFLDGANRISLMPKDGIKLPIVTVKLGEEKRWIIFSRVFGSTDIAKKVRVYAIGWQRTIKGVNEKNILWVYPGGTVELADAPEWNIIQRMMQME